jgi:PAS domain S-box-containing protein
MEQGLSDLYRWLVVVAHCWERGVKGLRRFMDWPLRSKLMALLVAAALLPLIVSTAIDIRDARQRLVAQSAALLAARGDQLSGELDSLIDKYQHAAERIAHVPNALQPSAAASADIDPANFESLHKLLSVMPASDRNVAAVAILDAGGVVKVASDPRLVGAPLAYRDFVQQALKGVPVTSDIDFSEPQIGSLPTTAFAVPILGDGGRVIGLALLWVRAAALWDVMGAANSLAGPDSFAVLFDHHGIRIAHTYSKEVVFHPGAALDAKTIDALVAQQRFGPRTRQLLEDVRAFPEAYRRSLEESPSGSIFRGFSPVNSQWNYVVGRRLRTVPWTLFYMIPEGALLTEIAHMTRNKLLFAGIIGLLVLFVGALVAANIVKPVLSLSKATEAIAHGDLTTRVQVRGADELQRLGASFNTMAGRIEAQATDLRRARDELEARVQERTAELARIAKDLELEVLERTRAQEHSRASQQLLRGIVESSDDAIISKGLDGVITSWNPAAHRLFGFTAPEAIGRPLQIIIPPERLHEEPEILARIARGESVDHFETVRVRADGTRVDISATISPVRDAQGHVVGASKIARDITERKAAERKMRAHLERLSLLQQITRAMGERQDLASIFQVVIGTLADQLPVDFGCVCLYEPPDDFLTVACVGPRTAEVAEQLGLAERSRLKIDNNGLSRCIRGQLVYEPDVSESLYPLPQRLAGNGFRSIVIAPLVVESHVFGVLLVARRLAQGFSSGDCEFLGQLTEHTALAAQQADTYGALQRAYEDLRQTQQAVMQQERLRVLGQMASGIAHDINNAISPIMIYTDVLLDKEPGLSPRAREFLQTIQQAISDVAETVSRMKEFYREREPQLQLAPVQLNLLARQVLDLTRARWSDMALRRGAVIEVSAVLADDLPNVMGVESEIREALTNLVLNAVDALPQGGKITLCTRVAESVSNSPVEARLRRVYLEVIDTGLGMDESTRERCLEPFFTTKGEQGTGLGLAMVYGTAQRHGAEVEIESTLGRGTTMRLSFPLPRSNLSAVIQPQAVPARTAHLRILLVDDDPVLLKSLRDALEGDGHTVTAANGGQAGIDAFAAARDKDQEFAIVITDLGMPYIDGRKVAAAVKTASPQTPVILLTGWGQRLSIEGDVPPHVDRIMSKPPKMAQLRITLAEVTRSA